MKRIGLLLFIALVVFGSAIAQETKLVVPGYMGLKFYVQYQGGINPQWNNLSYSYLPYLSHNIQIGYVISRKYEVGLQYTRIDYGSGSGANIYDYSGNFIATDYRHFTGNNVMAYIKIFRERKGFIAPLGRYYLLGLSYENSVDKYHVTSDANSIIGAPNNTFVKSHDLAITVGVGRNFILARRLVVSIEGDVNIPFSSGIRAVMSGANTFSNDGITGTPNAYKHFNAVDVMLVNLFQLKIGIGALIF